MTFSTEVLLLCTAKAVIVMDKHTLDSEMFRHTFYSATQNSLTLFWILPSTDQLAMIQSLDLVKPRLMPQISSFHLISWFAKTLIVTTAR